MSRDIASHRSPCGLRGMLARLRAWNAAAKEAAAMRDWRLTVAADISREILKPQRERGPSADPLQHERDAQAREDAATARRVGKWR